MEEPIGSLSVKQTAEVGCNKQIEPPVAVVVHPGSGETRSPRTNARFLADVRECSISVVAPQLTFASVKSHAAHAKIRISIIIVVASSDAKTVCRPIQSRLNAYVRERSVTVVAIERDAGVGGSDCHVQEAVVVIVEDCDSPGAAGLVQSATGRYVLVSDG